MSIGERIRHIRKSKNISLRALSAMTGLSKTTLSELETGKYNNPTRSTIQKIADALEIPASLVLGEETAINEAANELFKIAQFNGELANLTEDEKRNMMKDMLLQEPSLYFQIGEEVRGRMMVGETAGYVYNSNELLKQVNAFLNNESISLEEKTNFIKAVMDMYSKLLGGKQDA